MDRYRSGLSARMSKSRSEFARALPRAHDPANPSDLRSERPSTQTAVASVRAWASEGVTLTLAPRTRRATIAGSGD